MAAFEITVLAVSALVLALWITRITTVYSAKARGPVLGADTIPNVPPSGKVSIIMPVKDEEANVAAALETLRAQDYPDIEIIVVDDRSRDRTAEIVRGIAAVDPRVHLVQVKELPAGWFGKPHAMHVGAAEARGEWLLFVDADCRQAPHSARAAANFLADRSGDMLSLWPILEMHGFWEHAVQPVAGSVLVAWFRPGWVNDPRRRTAFANGQYIMIRRSVYQAVGGHESVRTEIVEDIALARRAKGAGHRLWNVIGVDLFTTRMYDTLGVMYKGWSRIYCGGFKRPAMLVAVAAVTGVFTLLPFVILPAVAVAMAAGAADPLTLALFGASLASLAAIIITMRRLMIAGRANPWYLFFYPISVVLVLWFLAGALVRALGRHDVPGRQGRGRKIKANSQQGISNTQ